MNQQLIDGLLLIAGYLGALGIIELEYRNAKRKARK